MSAAKPFKPSTKGLSSADSDGEKFETKPTDLGTTTQAPESEALSHKPTQGLSAELPQVTEPAGDPTIPANGERKPASSDDALEAPNSQDHDLPEAEKAALQQWVDQQSRQLNPDEVQRSGDWPSTESLTGSRESRPMTIDPMTGQLHVAGKSSALNGPTVAHEGE